MRVWIGLLAAALSAPAGAEWGGELRLVGQDKDDSPQNVLEFDGRQRDAAELDLWYGGPLGSGGLLDLGLFDLNSANESGFLHLNQGGWFVLKAEGSKLTHRQAINPNGVVFNGVFVENKSPILTGDFNGISPDRYDGSDLQFDRVSQDLRARLALPSLPEFAFSAELWGEFEDGARPYVYYDRGARKHLVTAQGFDRQNLEGKLGAEGRILGLDLTYDYARQDFRDDAPAVLVSTTVTAFQLGGAATTPLWTFAPTVSDRHRLGFARALGARTRLAGALTARLRRNELNNFETETYAANLGVSHQASPRLSLTGRVYYTAVNAFEDKSTERYVKGSGKDLLDIQSLKGDFRARYSGFKRTTLKAAWRPELNDRRYWDQNVERFDAQAAYSDGTIVPAFFHENGVANSDFKNTFELGADVKGPARSELGLDYRFMTANRPAFNSSPTLAHETKVGVGVPCPRGFDASASWERVDQRTLGAAFTDLERRLDRVLAGLAWMEPSGRASLGVNYAFEDGRDSITAYFGASNSAGSNTINNLIREAGAPFDYRNHVFGGFASVRLPAGWRVSGNLSYTDSKGDFLVTKADDFFTAGGAMTSLSPVNVDILRWGLSTSYDATEQVSARAGFYVDQWDDRLVQANDGGASVAELALSARF